MLTIALFLECLRSWPARSFNDRLAHIVGCLQHDFSRGRAFCWCKDLGAQDDAPSALSQLPSVNPPRGRSTRFPPTFRDYFPISNILSIFESREFDTFFNFLMKINSQIVVCDYTDKQLKVILKIGIEIVIVDLKTFFLIDL